MSEDNERNLGEDLEEQGRGLYDAYDDGKRLQDVLDKLKAKQGDENVPTDEDALRDRRAGDAESGGRTQMPHESTPDGSTEPSGEADDMMSTEGEPSDTADAAPTKTNPDGGQNEKTSDSYSAENEPQEGDEAKSGSEKGNKGKSGGESSGGEAASEAGGEAASGEAAAGEAAGGSAAAEGSAAAGGSGAAAGGSAAGGSAAAGGGGAAAGAAGTPVWVIILIVIGVIMLIQVAGVGAYTVLQNDAEKQFEEGQHFEQLEEGLDVGDE